ncbi:MAG: hypothetical protein ACR2IF_05930 [Terriglobales bacterium]
MSAENSPHIWVFREGRRATQGRALLDGLASALRALSSNSTRDALVDALLRAGELECALEDAAWPGAARVARITDLLAAALAGAPDNALLPRTQELLEQVSTPQSVDVATPEGFVYYALHPMDFARVMERAGASSGAVAVIGIRSIGTTLSAVVAAAAVQCGLRATRTTVRPTGHPYDRRTCFAASQLRWIASCRAAQAQFFVVDEGPGLSGSSFLSVADALLEAGVERRQITFLCSREPNPDALVAPDAAARWRSFRVLATQTTHVPPEAVEPLGGGEWRRNFYAGESLWPASWTQMERLKFASRDRRRWYKFEGHGHFGQAVSERSRLLGEAGFSPKLLGRRDGFGEYALVQGRAMSVADLSSELLERIADYCALRAVEFSCRTPETQLRSMVGFNLREQLGIETENGLDELSGGRPVITDNRMLPHEWMIGTSGALLKTDAASHGDDHFFPGPVDIAWDLAGAIVEWEMSSDAAQFLMDRFRRRSGDDARKRLPAYVLGYSVFRMAYCSMAAFAMRGTAEEIRLRRAAQRYRAQAEAQAKTRLSCTLQASVQERERPVSLQSSAQV